MKKFLVELSVNDEIGAIEIYAKDKIAAEMIVSSMFEGFSLRAHEIFRNTYGYSAPITNIKPI